MNTYWDSCYESGKYVYGKQPNRFLKAQAAIFKSEQTVISIGDGEGRNGVWLAEQGLNVLSIDNSSVGLAKARALSRERNTNISTLQTDLLTWTWPNARFDHVVVVFIHFAPIERKRMHIAFRRALKPSGHLIYVAFSPTQLAFRTGGLEKLELLVTGAMLKENFAGMKILTLKEGVEDLSEGSLHQGLASTVRMVARV